MTSRNCLRLSKLSIGLIAALAAAPVFAQSTSAGVGGLVTDSSGQPVAGAEVVITHVESGTVSRATTDSSGRYVARGLRVGGPYEITVTKAGEGTRTEDNVYLSLNQANTVNATLTGDMTTLATVTAVATGGSVVFSTENKGVGTSVDGRKMEITPQGNRSIDDVARLDPRIQVLDQASGSISVAGVNNRFNSITVDGLSQGDPFGLTSNGLPYTNSPISVDTIAAYDLKVSDYDVTSDSVGATINAVTKSGTNEFHGSVYYALKDASSMVASRNGEDYALFDKDEVRGVTFGGPIIKDRLFFFASYEEQEVSDFGGATPEDGVSTGRISVEDVNEAIRIANSLGMRDNAYGALGVNLENKRYLAKIDWNINEYHRASLTYQQTEENRPSPYDVFADTAVLTNHWYNIDNVTRNTSLQLFSDWTDRFSTEFKVSRQRFDQINGASVKNTEAIVTVPGGRIFIGEDDNRHENQINTDRLTASLVGTLFLDDHTIKGGIDYLRHDVFNLYGKTLHGEYLFDSLADFEAGNYSRYTIRRPAEGYSEADTAAALVYSQLSPYIQDTWQATDKLSLTYGVRVNIPRANKAPERTPGFEETFGFPNNYKLGSDNKVVLPRVSFNYMFDTERYSQLRGGVGLFQSVPPFVWLANPYQNNGVTSVSYTSFDPEDAPFSADPYNQPIPSGGASSAAYQVDAIDPDFKLPTVWKVSLGYDAELPWWGLVGTVEAQYLKNKDGVFYRATNIGAYNPETGLYDAPTGQMADGRGSYWCTLGVTSSSNKNCGRASQFDWDSTLLGNTDKGESLAVTFALDKPLANGWYANLSYTYTKATEVGSDGSSQAWSSYQFVSRINPNDEIASIASREIRNSIKASLGWEHAFFGDYKTSVTAYYNGRDGLPYTWIFNTQSGVRDANGDGVNQDPAYIPLVNDPRVSYGSATPEQIAAFHEFIARDPYLDSRRGTIANRNGDRLPWVNQVDLGIQQELPGFFKGHKSVIRLDIYNFLNLLDRDWGVTGSVGGFDTRNLVVLSGINADGTYVYDLGRDNPATPEVEIPNVQPITDYDASPAFPNRLVSRWSAMLTFRYQF
jgi:hypothetical protein